MKKLITLLLIVCSPVYAQDTVVLHKGDIAPFDGVLLSQPKAEQVRQIKLDLDLKLVEVDILTRQNKLLMAYTATSEQHIQSLSKQVVESRDNSMLGKIGYFLLGAATTTIIAYGVSQSLR